MDIACPNCAATYRVPDAMVDGVNALRCAACGQAWVPTRPAPAEEPSPVVHAPMPEPASAIEGAPPPLPDPPPPSPAPVVEPPPPPPPLPEPPATEAFAALPPAPPPTASDESHVLPATRAGPPGLAPRRLPEAPVRRRSAPSGLSLAWAASITVVVAFVMVLVLFHAQIAEIWPPFARLAG